VYSSAWIDDNVVYEWCTKLLWLICIDLFAYIINLARKYLFDLVYSLSEGCFIFNFTSLSVDVARLIYLTMYTQVAVKIIQPDITIMPTYTEVLFVCVRAPGRIPVNIWKRTLIGWNKTLPISLTTGNVF